MSKDELKNHLKAVLEELPLELQERSELRYRSLYVADEVTVSLERAWCGKPKMRLELGYKITSNLSHLTSLKNRAWGERKRDGKYCYARVAGYVVKAIDALDALNTRRATGLSVATMRGSKLKAAFAQDVTLSGLKLNLTVRPVRSTEVGQVNVHFSPRDSGPTSSLKFDGKVFTGQVDIGSCSAEQVTALMAVIHLKQMNLIELITLADDSILGPSIQKMTEEMSDE
jgi:hypothetical protein